MCVCARSHTHLKGTVRAEIKIQALQYPFTLMPFESLEKFRWIRVTVFQFSILGELFL